MAETPKRRWPRAAAMAVAERLFALLLPACERVAMAGSLRRGKPDVGDVELLFIPRVETRANPADLFAEMQVDLAEGVIDEWLSAGVLTKRLSADGRTSWGPKNKLAVHAATGIPVDLFTATRENWWNYLVCRTGPAESNMQIAGEAQKRGWKWNPYGVGFSRGGRDDQDYEESVVTCEADVFRFAGLPVPKWVPTGEGLI